MFTEIASTDNSSLPWFLGALNLPHRLIQGPLAGFSCSPMRALFYRYTPPAYCVSEMISAHDVIYKHSGKNRYLHRAPDENKLCYQLSGNDGDLMAKAAKKLEFMGADLIDINCGCPKAKIRKRGAGSALLETPDHLVRIVEKVRDALQCPLTVKIRLQNTDSDLALVQVLEKTGIDALIVHGRRWQDDYDVACNWQAIRLIKKAVKIPVIANGDICERNSLAAALAATGCDAFMISRAGTGKPWLYQQLLSPNGFDVELEERIELFLRHLEELSWLENEFQAVLQSKSLIRYYFRELGSVQLQTYYALNSLPSIKEYMTRMNKHLTPSSADYVLHPHLTPGLL
ncbi:tRNA-dihydrouridine synthase [Legionella sp. 16cNR16C]|uniref:tRNA dihydrouridine synthase n=1 Tax=Legionella sp. 16cNR16C TaxID=2905656 RepID=UPI001E2CF599|nr:tRNA-dihydrouridine synthase family protein [Legionella sp. 16cNR16C]MCE3045058.1 tRNA-dihydrouridine synthase family protein [Legionella sp. 16cNR16C]